MRLVYAATLSNFFFAHLQPCRPQLFEPLEISWLEMTMTFRHNSSSTTTLFLVFWHFLEAPKRESERKHAGQYPTLPLETKIKSSPSLTTTSSPLLSYFSPMPNSIFTRKLHGLFPTQHPAEIHTKSSSSFLRDASDLCVIY